jgi:hypothetical protein
MLQLQKHACVCQWVCVVPKKYRMLKIYRKWVNSLYKESMYNHDQSLFFTKDSCGF